MNRKELERIGLLLNCGGKGGKPGVCPLPGTVSPAVKDTKHPVYYHTTETKNLPSIKKRGLIPGGGRDQSKNTGYESGAEDLQGVYVHHDLKLARGQFDATNLPGSKQTLLRIKPSVSHRKALVESKFSGDLAFVDSIHPKHIERLDPKTKTWKKL